MYSIEIQQCFNILKRYNVNIQSYKNTRYDGDTSWIAMWFYNYYDYTADNITIHIRGDFHQTYPNPKHLSVKFEYNTGFITPWIHLSLDEYGNGYMQHLPSAGLKTNKKKTNKKKTNKRKTNKRKTNKRKINKK